MLQRPVHPPFCFELTQWSFEDGLLREVERFEQVSLTELLLIELMLDLSHSVTFFNFLYETHVVLAESFDDGVKPPLPAAPGSFFVGGDQSWEGNVVFSGHADGKQDRNDGI